MSKRNLLKVVNLKWQNLMILFKKLHLLPFLFDTKTKNLIIILYILFACINLVGFENTNYGLDWKTNKGKNLGKRLDRKANFR